MRGCSCRGTAGFAHVSCLAEEAKILLAEAEENNLDDKVKNERWDRWQTCSLCEQDYHGVVRCALGWGCWKTYVGRPETDQVRVSAMNMLGIGLSAAGLHEDALTVQEAELSVCRRIGAPEVRILDVQSNLANSYQMLGRFEEALRMRRDIYSGTLKLEGAEHEHAILAAFNYASSLLQLKRFEETKSLMLRTIPAARRNLGESHDLTLSIRSIYASALHRDTCATLDNLREAVTTLEDTNRTARRVLGGQHPTTKDIERDFRNARAKLNARETPLPGTA